MSALTLVCDALSWRVVKESDAVDRLFVYVSYKNLPSTVLLFSEQMPQLEICFVIDVLHGHSDVEFVV